MIDVADAAHDELASTDASPWACAVMVNSQSDALDTSMNCPSQNNAPDGLEQLAVHPPCVSVSHDPLQVDWQSTLAAEVQDPWHDELHFDLQSAVGGVDEHEP